MKRKVFYSFHYEKDFWRVNQIRNMGVVAGSEPVIPNLWEEIKRQGDRAIKQWVFRSLLSGVCRSAPLAAFTPPTIARNPL